MHDLSLWGLSGKQELKGSACSDLLWFEYAVMISSLPKHVWGPVMEAWQAYREMYMSDYFILLHMCTHITGISRSTLETSTNILNIVVRGSQ